ncbi:protein disulfide reductase, TlpA family [Aliarcobacter faecis]|uniref:TlpA family protein disulfide reductase n=1 Tax=Aliarcobacter faecis TaxID=1564138 RepID=UPI00047AC70A|nr:TlpA disulfide reductase family protein [Aliarcobacter faecis]QKF73578.1 protein disulfide reductase, TlpA family [Aliarcobacter faecis]
MKIKTLAIFSIFSILFFAGCDSKENKQSNEQAKVEQNITKNDFILNSLDGDILEIKSEENKIHIKNYEDKIVVLNFFTTWCPACKVEIPALIRLQNEYKNDLVVISMLLEEFKSDQEIKNFAKEFGINYKITIGSENFDLAKSLGGIKSIPTTFIIDKQGKVYQKIQGLAPFEMMEIDIKKVLEK